MTSHAMAERAPHATLCRVSPLNATESVKQVKHFSVAGLARWPSQATLDFLKTSQICMSSAAQMGNPSNSKTTVAREPFATR